MAHLDNKVEERPVGEDSSHSEEVTLNDEQHDQGENKKPTKKAPIIKPLPDAGNSAKSDTSPRRDFYFLPIPSYLRYDPDAPVRFDVFLNILFGVASTFGALFDSITHDYSLATLTL